MVNVKSGSSAKNWCAPDAQARSGFSSPPLPAPGLFLRARGATLLRARNCAHARTCECTHDNACARKIIARHNAACIIVAASKDMGELGAQ